VPALRKFYASLLRFLSQWFFGSCLCNYLRFGLTYRQILGVMPADWQSLFVACRVIVCRFFAFFESEALAIVTGGLGKQWLPLLVAALFRVTF
jgi:hypothetical protein